jgi:Tfp pilus assembly protein PilV
MIYARNHRPRSGLAGKRIRRAGFTLLEVILAALVTVLLMVALYVTLNMQYWHAEAGRNAVEQSTLAQGLMKRVADDISQELAPLVPDTSGASGASGGGAAAAAPAGGASTPASTTAPAASTSPASGTSSGTSSSTAGAGGNISGGPVTFNYMVQGTDSQLTLYVSRFPREVLGADRTNPPLVSDLRRVTYWLAGGSGSASGLARQEVKQETSNDALTTMPPDVPDPESFVISSRVRSLTFAYWDGQAWQDSWDGTTATGSDGTTPQGPPMAIRIEMKIARASGADDAKSWKTYRQTVYIPTANRLMPTTLTPLGTGP